MLMRVSEAARKLNLEESTLRKWIFQKRIPTVKLGRSIRLKESDITALIEQGTSPAIQNLTNK